MEIKVPRIDVSAGPRSLAWSCDGLLAIAAGVTAVVFVPENGPGPLRWARQDAALGDALEWTPDAAAVAPSSTLLVGAGAPALVTDVLWSPSGLSAMRGCFLACLTSRGTVHLLHNNGNPWTAQWAPWANATEALARDLQAAAPGALLDPRELYIHAAAWSPADRRDDARDGARLALASATGALHVYRVKDYALQLELTVPGPAGDASPLITQLLWTKRGLVVGTSDNSSYIESSVELQAAPRGTESLGLDLRPSRFRLSGLFESPVGVVACLTGKTHVYTTGGRPLILELPADTAAVGIVHGWSGRLEPTPSTLTVLLADGGSLTVNARDGTSAAPSKGLARVLAKKSQASELQIAGVASNWDGTVVAVLYETFKAGSWRYPIPSAQTFHVALLPTGKQPDLRNVNILDMSITAFKESLLLTGLPPLGDDVQEHAASLAAADAQAGLEESLRVIFSGSEADRLRGQLAASISNSEGVHERAKKVDLQIREAVAKCLWTHWEQSQGETDTVTLAILRSYAHFLPQDFVVGEHGAGNGPVELLGDGLTEAFDLDDQKDPNILRAESGREWKRCAITLLPVLSLHTVRSTEGNYTKLKAEALPNPVPPLASALLAAADACVFNGSRWYDPRAGR